MTIYLDRLNFTNAADIVPGPLFSATITNTANVNTLDGDDMLTGIQNFNSASEYGILNIGTIDTGKGNDTISGLGASGGIKNTGRIITGSGDDKIFTNDRLGNTGLSNYGTIDTGSGNDSILDNGANIGLINYGTIDTGTGNDTIASGRFLYNYGAMNTGSGNDTIRSQQVINKFNATINTGAGDDTIKSDIFFGIDNEGTINTGAGKDIVDSLTQKGFTGNGYLNLGEDNDTIKGFGTGHFDGGNGTDTLLFGDGIYKVSATKNFEGFYTITQGTTQMLVKNFEFIGSSNDFTRLTNFSSLIGGSIDLTKITEIG
jgi:hypothetical protein